MDKSPPVLDESARKELLALARRTLENYFVTGRVAKYQTTHPALVERCGAFVSLHRGEELRGCIGLLSGEEELYRTVQHCAISAAFEDSRFTSVTPAELPYLKIEISVLSPLERIRDVNLIEVGKHGLLVSLGGLRGLLLPQVADQYHWDRETFLAQTCRKAGLPADAWREPNVVIHTFEAQVFSE
jgi:AmmeMemoRadiSam system protein A